MHDWGDISERSSKGQVVSNFQRHPISMNDIPNCSSWHVHFKNVYFYYILAFIFEIRTFKQIHTVILEQKVPMYKWLIFYYRKSIKQIIPFFTPNVFCSRHTLTLQYMRSIFDKIWLTDFKNFKTFFSKLIWCNIGTSLIELFIYNFCVCMSNFGRFLKENRYFSRMFARMLFI